MLSKSPSTIYFANFWVLSSYWKVTFRVPTSFKRPVRRKLPFEKRFEDTLCLSYNWSRRHRRTLSVNCHPLQWHWIGACQALLSKVLVVYPLGLIVDEGFISWWQPSILLMVTNIKVYLLSDYWAAGTAQLKISFRRLRQRGKRDLTKLRRRRQRQRQRAIGLVSKKTTLLVHHVFLYISWPSLHDYNVKWPDFKFFFLRRERQGDKLYHLCLNSGVIPLQLQHKFNSLPLSNRVTWDNSEMV